MFLNGLKKMAKMYNLQCVLNGLLHKSLSDLY